MPRLGAGWDVGMGLSLEGSPSDDERGESVFRRWAWWDRQVDVGRDPGDANQMFGHAPRALFESKC